MMTEIFLDNAEWRQQHVGLTSSALQKQIISPHANWKFGAKASSQIMSHYKLLIEDK